MLQRGEEGGSTLWSLLGRREGPPVPGGKTKAHAHASQDWRGHNAKAGWHGTRLHKLWPKEEGGTIRRSEYQKLASPRSPTLCCRLAAPPSHRHHFPCRHCLLGLARHCSHQPTHMQRTLCPNHRHSSPFCPPHLRHLSSLRPWSLPPEHLHSFGSCAAWSSTCIPPSTRPLVVCFVSMTPACL